MNPRELTTRKVHAALEREPRINIHRFPIAIGSADGVVVLEGEVADVAAKKLAIDLAASVGGVSGIVDRLRVAPGERRGDGAVRDSFARMLLEYPEFRNCTLRAHTNERHETLREVRDGVGDIEISVKDGVITLEGRVLSQSHRRFAGVLAWWTPGRRDVVNCLEVRPDYEDRDDEIAEVMRLVLEADSQVNADQVRAGCSNGVVTLEGNVPTAEQKRRAELDAWALYGVTRVVNRLNVTD
ncbi:MAG TPA: BON domain-containing protein [Burkholderiales bacterium]|nr:BON domain-containing protein [Burkholderiales bacterium]